jgi:Protein of unknown function (DUF2442)
MLHDVIEARPIGGYRVFLRFDDGVEGEIDLSSLMIFEGVFAPLKTAERFAEMRVNPDLGTICWPNGADIAPEALYEALLQHLRRVTAR